MRSFYPVSELFCWENIAQGEKKIVEGGYRDRIVIGDFA
jgi:hypothetical protein